MNKFFFLFCLIFGVTVLAEEAPRVGRKAAAKYFENDEVSKRVPSSNGSGGGGTRLLMLSLGTYTGSKAYLWKGSETRENVGRSSYGVTYLFDEWRSLDVNLRIDFNEFKIDDDRALKMSLLPIITFPSAEARFPLYFGFGAGLGVFFQQVPEESQLALDYQLIAGARFSDLFENFGFFFEFGMKNHLHVLSDGQLNGSALTTGAVFSF